MNALETLRTAKLPRLIHEALAMLWRDMRVSAATSTMVPGVLREIEAGKERYSAVAGITRVPWPVIGILHQLECSGSFRQHLHNGDSLVTRTRNVPAGRPVEGRPPFRWEDSAVDALRYDGLHRADWRAIGPALAHLEAYNGLGYRKRGVASPYLWSGTNHYAAGKFVADGKYDPAAVSRQIGVAVLLQACVSRHWITFTQ